MNACWLPIGIFVGVLLTLIGCRPGESTVERLRERDRVCLTAVEARVLPDRVEAADVADGARLIDGDVRDDVPGSHVDRPSRDRRLPIVPSRPTVNGPDHVVPWSVERRTRTKPPRIFLAFSLLNSVKMSTSVPFGCTTIWLPMVWSFWPGSQTCFAGSHVTPASVERANQVGPLNALVLNEATTLARSLAGKTRRSQTA